MAPETSDHETSGSAIAAFTLAQMTFWQLLKQGLLPKSDAEHMLKVAVKANQKGGPGNQHAAAKLAVVLQNIQAYQRPESK
jgi:hypothetical protein